MKKVRCLLCPRGCELKEGERGNCRSRMNIGGKLQTIVYGKPCAVHPDPIEKKPFYHFLPGSQSFSVATPGCNMACKFCQNWDLSQQGIDEVKTVEMAPEKIVAEALTSGAKSIAYTYSEPTIFFEFMLETAKLAKQKGLKNVMHSNGYINQEPLKEIIPYLDAANIDLKGMSDKFYQDYTQNGKVGPVLETLKTLKQNGVLVEVTNLLVPGGNDKEDDIKSLTLWIKDNLGVDTPLHFSRFLPMYKLQNLIPTPEKTLIEARRLAREQGLKYVYIGNVEIPDGGTTFCPDGQVAIKRQGYFIIENNLIKGGCLGGGKIEGVWE